MDPKVPVFILFLAVAMSSASGDLNCDLSAEEQCESSYAAYQDCISHVFGHCSEVQSQKEIDSPKIMKEFCEGEAKRFCQDQEDYRKFTECSANFEKACRNKEEENKVDEEEVLCKEYSTSRCEGKHLSNVAEYSECWKTEMMICTSEQEGLGRQESVECSPALRRQIVCFHGYCQTVEYTIYKCSL